MLTRRNKNNNSSLEIALLAIFTLSLLIAAFVTSLRNRIPMSPPMKLDFAAISVSIPQGRQWRSLDEWKYNKVRNNFVLASNIVQDKLVIAFAELTYILAPDITDPVKFLENNISKRHALKIADKGTIARDGIEVYWYYATSESIPGGYYFAAAKLPADRILQIDVFAYRNEALATEIFDTVMKDLSFGKNQTIEDSLNFVKHLKQKKLPALIQNETGRSSTRIYLTNITEPVDTNIQKQNIFDGFVIERFSFDNSSPDKPIQCKSFFMMNDPIGQCDDTRFTSDLTFDTFTWRRKRTTLQGTPILETQTELDSKGLLSFTNIHAEPTPSTKRPGPLTIPEILVDTVATEFLTYQAATVYIDLIFQNGAIVPAQLIKLKPENINANTKDIHIAVNVQLLNRLDNSQNIYFDKNNKIIAKIENAEMTATGHRSDAKGLIDAFPKWTDHINDILK